MVRFKREAYIGLARDWCEENDIPYEDKKPKESPSQTAIDRCSLDMIIIPLHAKSAEDAVEVLRDALRYSKSDAEQEMRRILKNPRVALAAIAENRVVGIIGAIPQYGVTGWELHPLAVYCAVSLSPQAWIWTANGGLCQFTHPMRPYP